MPPPGSSSPAQWVPPPEAREAAGLASAAETAGRAVVFWARAGGVYVSYKVLQARDRARQFGPDAVSDALAAAGCAARSCADVAVAVVAGGWLARGGKGRGWPGPERNPLASGLSVSPSSPSTSSPSPTSAALAAARARTRARRAALADRVADRAARREREWQQHHTKAGITLHDLCVDLRGFYLKFGQFLSARPDLLPPTLCRELRPLCDAVPPMPERWARQALERELAAVAADLRCRSGIAGADRVGEEKGEGLLPLVFASIDLARPLGSASVAQVHRASLREDWAERLAALSPPSTSDAFTSASFSSTSVSPPNSSHPHAHSTPNRRPPKGKMDNPDSPTRVRPVAVKIQYPGSLRVMSRDLIQIRAACALLSRFELDFDLVSAADELRGQSESRAVWWGVICVCVCVLVCLCLFVCLVSVSISVHPSLPSSPTLSLSPRSPARVLFRTRSPRSPGDGRRAGGGQAPRGKTSACAAAGRGGAAGGEDNGSGGGGEGGGGGGRRRQPRPWGRWCCPQRRLPPHPRSPRHPPFAGNGPCPGTSPLIPRTPKPARWSLSFAPQTCRTETP